MQQLRRWRWMCTLLLSAAALCAQQDGRGPFDFLRRLSDDPIIAPRGNGWEAAGTFNPAVVQHEGKIVMLYRAQDEHGTSRLGYAESKDGIHFSRSEISRFSLPKPTTKKTAASRTRGWFSSATPTT